MRWIDLLRMSGSSLWKRKLRTVLTILGVVIGVSSIVIMVSLGLGLKQIEMAEIEKWGNMTTVTVRLGEEYGAASKSSSEKKMLDDKLIEELSQIAHVERVVPVLSYGCTAKSGVYEGYLEITAMPAEEFQTMNLELKTGHLPEPGKLEFLYGNMILQNFTNMTTKKSYWETGILPDIDLARSPLFVTLDNMDYGNNNADAGQISGAAKPKKYTVKPAGLLAGEENEYTRYSWSTFCDINALKTVLKKNFKGKPIPGQPLTKSGKPYKEIYYTQLNVMVDSIDEVKGVAAVISDMGYQTSTDAEWIESEQQTLGYMQAVLGGIGGVSLLVAAIGITNTMMMSIYERTKEIGVMKVLGCDMKDILKLFLMEAGYIGFLGGVIGILLSKGASVFINHLVQSMGGMEGEISYIPLWLMGLSLGFAVLVGMLAGFFPSLRAMRLSPLSAIRNE